MITFAAGSRTAAGFSRSATRVARRFPLPPVGCARDEGPISRVDHVCDAAGVFGATRHTRVVGVLVGYLADLVFADPRAGHPVAGFGAVATTVQRLT